MQHNIKLNTYGNGKLNIGEIDLPESEREPVNIACVIDISGSMGTPTTRYGEEDNGLKIINLIIHCLKAVIKNMNENDNLVLVAYNHSAQNLLLNYENSLNMTDVNKDIVIGILESLIPNGTTNIWGGLEMGANILGGIDSNFPKHIILFTDGVPNVNPPNSYSYMVETKIKNVHKNILIHTLGFGYNIQSEILDNEISQISDGYYGFISDPQMMGTVITYLAANIYSYFGTDAKIIIGQNTIYLGNLHYGQKKTFEISKLESSHSDLNFKYLYKGDEINLTFSLNIENINQTNSLILINYLRKEIINTLSILIVSTFTDDLNMFILNKIKEYESTISSYNLSNNNIINNIMEDLRGEILLGVKNNKSFNDWGSNYFRSLRVAYKNELCNNFKDKGIQHFGGELFNNLLDEFEQTFMSIPIEIPPKRTTNGPIYRTPIQSSSYMNVNNSCFGGNCKILCKDTTKLVKDLTKNDIVLCPEGKDSKIVCIIKTCGNFDIIKLKTGLEITPWHPIRIENEWVFPISQDNLSLNKCNEVYNLILDNNHIVIINNIEVVTLGHGFEENNIIKHEYFGTNKVIEDLKTFNPISFEKGLILLKGNTFKRCESSGLINGL